ncbi:MAG: glycosyltransferase family 4 protein [Synechococcaceae cyanobacterium]|nr:glycosyltransferase family 4 protein [Synechococcaceae cyanobacterium]
MTAALGLLLLSAAVSWLLLAGLVPLLQRRMLDVPNARSSHRRPTPRGGGLAVVLVAQLALPLSLLQPARGALPWLPLLCLPLALVGMLDDRRGLPAGWRYAVQLLTAVALVLAAPQPLPWGLLPLLWLAVTAVINFTNFMDGLDGLVAGCMAVLLATALALLIRDGSPAPTALVALLPVTGALLGFLGWNWSPARVFLGDVGSTFLGALLAGVVLQLRQPLEQLGLLLVALPLLADAGSCVLRRWRAGQPVFQAHRLHLFQRLHQAGWSHGRVAGLWIAATGALALVDLLAGPVATAAAAVPLLALGVLLDQRMAVPFAAPPGGGPER